MAKRKKKGSADGADGAAESNVDLGLAAYNGGRVTQTWREDRNKLKYLKRACESLKSCGIDNPDNLDTFVDRVFKTVGASE